MYRLCSSEQAEEGAFPSAMCSARKQINCVYAGDRVKSPCVHSIVYARQTLNNYIPFLMRNSTDRYRVYCRSLRRRIENRIDGRNNVTTTRRTLYSSMRNERRGKRAPARYFFLFPTKDSIERGNACINPARCLR